MPPPLRVHIPLVQADGTETIPRVAIGSHVRIGEKIADPAQSSGVSLHASISGYVSSIARCHDPLAGEVEAVEITSDERDERLPEIGHERAGWSELQPEEIRRLLRQSGVVELDLGMTPVHDKARQKGLSSIRTLILNACEPEPYVASSYSLIMSHALEVLRGAEILRKMYGAEQVLVATEENKLEAAELFKSKIYFLKWNHVEVRTLPGLFPQGDEKILVKQLFQGKLQHGRSHLSVTYDNKKIAEDAIVHEAATAFAVFEAVVLQKPLYERVVTVGGECIVEPKNLWVRLGTEWSDLVKECRGLLREPRKVLMGGPMKGVAQTSWKVPAVKGTQAILALPKEVARPEEVEPCTRCGRCLEVCPVGISPAMITLAAERDLFEVASNYGADECIGCGNCAYICPSKRPMMELIRYALS